MDNVEFLAETALFLLVGEGFQPESELYEIARIDLSKGVKWLLDNDLIYINPEETERFKETTYSPTQKGFDLFYQLRDAEVNYQTPPEKISLLYVRYLRAEARAEARQQLLNNNGVTLSDLREKIKGLTTQLELERERFEVLAETFTRMTADLSHVEEKLFTLRQEVKTIAQVAESGQKTTANRAESIGQSKMIVLSLFDAVARAKYTDPLI